MSDVPHPLDPAVMNGVIPYMTMAGRAAEACDFYARAFGAKDLGRMPFADGHAWWDRAVAAGCTVLAPYERQFWGDDWGLLQDPFGLAWAILQPAAQA